MVENYLRQSALAPMGLIARVAAEADKEAGVKMGERPYHGMIGLRGNADDPAFTSATEKALGVSVAVEPNTASTKGATSVLWMGPDEWLILTAPDTAPNVIAALQENLAGQHVAVFDVSDSRSIIELSGNNARKVLMKGCGIDLHPRAFGPGQCAQSTLALAHVMIHQTATDKRSGTPTYQLYVHRSFAEYLWAWLEDAAGEYGVQVTSG